MENNGGAERQWESHRCAACEAHFDVGHRDVADDAPLVAAEIACPVCGKGKTVSVPKGTEKDLLVELEEEEEVDEGTGD